MKQTNYASCDLTVFWFAFASLAVLRLEYMYLNYTIPTGQPYGLLYVGQVSYILSVVSMIKFILSPA